MTAPQRFRELLAMTCAWFLAVFLGGVLLDIVYSAQLSSVENLRAGAAVYGEVADFLLILGVITALFALAATVVVWDVPAARNLFVISLLLLGLEFFAPIVLFPILLSLPGSSGAGLGPFLRLIPTALASLAALAGTRTVFLHRDRSESVS